MASRSSARAIKKAGAPGHRSTPWWKERRIRILLAAAGVVLLAVIALAAIFSRSSGSSGAGGSAGQYPFQVGRPGPGEPAQPIKLPASDGSTFDLSALRGQTVLLFFQEGVGCQPCWDQIKDVEQNFGQFRALGIDRFVSVTTDPVSALKQKVADERITTPVLSDGNLAVSKSYQANRYGMMGDQMDGHSFVLVNKDGVVSWRADYGGAPKYTMYLPVTNLLADISKGLGGTQAGR